MKQFEIKINENSIKSIDIHKYLIHGKEKNAIQFIIEATGCDYNEAKEIVEDIQQLMKQNRDEKISGWTHNNSSEDRNNIIDCNKRYYNELEARKLSLPKCPTCNSTNIQKISTVKRTGSILGLGILSKNIGKTFECKNCGYKW